jgi:hypothetical protein
MARILASLIGILALMSIIGCSNGAGLSPEVPADAGRGIEKSSAHHLWGLWRFAARPGDGTLDIVPLRGSEMHLNALTFLEPPSLVNLTIESLQFNGDIIEASIGLRHPFLGLTEFTGFDVCGIFITAGTHSGFGYPDLVMPGDGDTRLLNTDGYGWNVDDIAIIIY